MPRSNQQVGAELQNPDSGDTRAVRHFGDGYAGTINAARIQGYDSGTLAYVDVSVDSSGQIKTVSSGGGGGAVTVADGADVAEGSTADAAWSGSGSGTVVSILKKIVGVLTSTINVSVQNGSLAVTGTFWQATQPVSGTFFQATQPVSIASMPSTPVTGAFFQTTQPVSIATLPLPTGAATDANLTSILGSATCAPSAYTALDQLTRIRKSVEQQQKTQLEVLAALKPVAVRRPPTTLLHRS